MLDAFLTGAEEEIPSLVKTSFKSVSLQQWKLYGFLNYLQHAVLLGVLVFVEGEVHKC